jgi:hypothetical protein
MSERLSPPIVNEIDRILQKKFGAEQPSPRRRIVGESLHTEHAIYLSRELFQRWAGILDRARDLPASEFQDDVAKLRGEVDVLSLKVESIRQALVTSNKTIDELFSEIRDIRSTIQASAATITELYKAYVEAVSNIDIVQKVLLSQDEEAVIIWTIIDAPPFDDSLRTPIYEAQLRILRAVKGDTLLDFHVLNVSELPRNQYVQEIIPLDFDVLWQR